MNMQAVRVNRFGSPEVVVVQRVPVPAPGKGEVLVRVDAAGVGPWDAIIREGRSKVSPQPPLTLGSDLSGVIEAVGEGVTAFAIGDAIYGVTNPQFCGAQAEYAVAQAGMIAPRPRRLNALEAASAPVIAVTAGQMLSEYAKAKRGDTAMITGAAGNVGAYAVRMALQAGVHVVAVARPRDADMLRALGVETVIDVEAGEALPPVDVLLDLVGGSVLERAARAVRSGGKVVSVTSMRPPSRADVQFSYFYAEVSTERLNKVTEMFDAGEISARVGSVLPLAEARRAHEMLAGAPHEPGKIMLQVRGPGA
jgi:NADPH:quinone reductase-like Zn-dependent oxidoreductase